MIYPVIRILTLIFALVANSFSRRPVFAWLIFRAWNEAYLGERWNVWQELQAHSHSFTRGLSGSRKQGIGARILVGK